MADASLSPRMKMISLMYLVFIAMLALQMSKEVLSAFGLMNEKFEEVNEFSEEYNENLYNDLKGKASENKKLFGKPFDRAKKVKDLTKEFYTYLGELKKDVEADYERNPETNKLPYESMDKGDKLNELWFAGDGYSKKGKEVIGKIEGYKNDLIKLFEKDTEYQFILKGVRKTFNTEDVKAIDGAKKKYLDYHYKGFPAVASLTKLTAMQNDVKKTEQDIYNALVGNTTAKTASMDNYKAIVIMDKSAFFAGEAVKGRVVLGRYDENTVPSEVVINDEKLDLSKSLKAGQVHFDFSAGNVGEHDIKGKFTFIEGGVEKPIDIDGNYVVVPRPNSATISADKMNVLYRGVDNPLTISFAGISDNKVNASAPGLKRAGKAGKYKINVTTLKARNVTIKVNGTLPDGSAVGDKKKFRVKGIPAPQGAIRGETGTLKGPKSSLAASTVSAVLQDFVFDLNLKVTQFNIKIPGQPTIKVQGKKLNSRAKKALNRAKRGDQVTIFDIKAQIVGNSSYRLKKSAPVIYEITN